MARGGRASRTGTSPPARADSRGQATERRVSRIDVPEMSGDGPDGGDKWETGLATKTRPKTKKPSMYRVLLLNDDYTPMEFVVEILEGIFKKSREDAVMIMLHVHQHGVGVCGVFTYEVAETKVAQVLDAARRNQHPLQCTMEKE
jgi:ATP-dependent Clp protease adaptor protein ClpS